MCGIRPHLGSRTADVEHGVVEHLREIGILSKISETTRKRRWQRASEDRLLRRELIEGGRTLASTVYTVDDQGELTKASVLFFKRR